MIRTEEEFKGYKDAVDAVCIECVEDTAGDDTICERCPVRKSYDTIYNGVFGE